MLLGAPQIYERKGFTLTKQFRHSEFGIPMTGETWDLELGA